VDPTVVLQDANCFELIIQMCDTLNHVCVDELEAQGHNPECCAMLLTVMSTSGELIKEVHSLNEQMMERFGGQVNLTILGDPEEEEA